MGAVRSIAVIHYSRAEWAALAADWALLIPPMSVIAPEEVREVFLPLLKLFEERRPFVIGVCGSVAVGKTTFCEVLQALIEATGARAEIVSTDGFLYPNRLLEERGMMNLKGFPSSYDRPRVRRFLADLHERKPTAAPQYSHEKYDVEEGNGRPVGPCDFVIFEGVAAMSDPSSIDLSIYLDASEEDVERWFLARVLGLRESATPESYYWQFRKMANEEFVARAKEVWRSINLVNLRDHIAPLRESANVVMKKEADHRISQVSVRL